MQIFRYCPIWTKTEMDHRNSLTPNFMQIRSDCVETNTQTGGDFNKRLTEMQTIIEISNYRFIQHGTLFATDFPFVSLIKPIE
jgi:hypothetical protein